MTNRADQNWPESEVIHIPQVTVIARKAIKTPTIPAADFRYDAARAMYLARNTKAGKRCS